MSGIKKDFNKNRPKCNVESDNTYTHFYPPPLLDQINLPYYFTRAFLDLYEEDGLVVLSKGMGCICLLAVFCRFYSDIKSVHFSILLANEDVGIMGNNIQRSPLVFVLGLQESERSTLLSILSCWNTPPNLLPYMISNESGQGKDRAIMYERGGIFGITSRILIVDLLTGLVKPENIYGILVIHAETVVPESIDAFIVRIFRTQNRYLNVSNTNYVDFNNVTIKRHEPTYTKKIESMKSYGFIKAFTDEPYLLISECPKIHYIMESLFLKRLYLYPRYHYKVAHELEDPKYTPHIEEFHQPLTSRMKDIENSIVSAIQTCIQEMKNSMSSIDWSNTDLTVDNCATTNYEMVVFKRLEHDWHRIQPSTKQLVNDIRTLRSLFYCLTHYDCVTFWKIINSIKSINAGSRNPSLWLLTPVAEILFQTAKDRIYRIVKHGSKQKEFPNLVSRLVPILEENPKWALLIRTLCNIQLIWKERMMKMARKQTLRSKSRKCLSKIIPVKTALTGTVLIMVKDERTLEFLKSYLIYGKDRVMTLEWLRYLEGFNDKTRSVPNILAINEECRLLLEEEGRARNSLFGANRLARNKLDTTHNLLNDNIYTNAYLKKRQLDDTEINGQALNVNNIPKRKRRKHIFSQKMYRVKNKNIEVFDSIMSDEIVNENIFKVQEVKELKVVLRTYFSAESDKAYLILNETKPDFVILYDVETFFIRALEIYSVCLRQNLWQRMHSEKQRENEYRLYVYLIMLEASLEEKNVLKILEMEKKAFENLIKKKKSIPTYLNTHAVYKALDVDEDVKESLTKSASPLSGITTTRQKDIVKRDIAVDIREFRSSLPSILHLGGMRLAPVTLTVGDFILSNFHCVERKSVNDLFGSFISGRLYSQVQSMSKHYKFPCLLIEFQAGQSFSLQNKNDIGNVIRTDSIISKITILVLHFPKLRILWTRNPYETLKLFKALKEDNEEVEVVKATQIGRNDSIDGILNDLRVIESFGIDHEKILLRLPGMTIRHVKKVMNQYVNIVEFVNLSRNNLKEILGPIRGQKLFTFLTKRIAAV